MKTQLADLNSASASPFNAEYILGAGMISLIDCGHINRGRFIDFDQFYRPKMVRCCKVPKS